MTGFVRLEHFLVREEDAVTHRERDVAGDLPIQKDVRLPAEECLAIGRLQQRLIDDGFVVRAVEEEPVGADLDAGPRAPAVGEGEGAEAEPEAREVRYLRGEGEAGVEQAEAVERVVVRAGVLPPNVSDVLRTRSSSPEAMISSPVKRERRTSASR